MRRRVGFLPCCALLLVLVPGGRAVAQEESETDIELDEEFALLEEETITSASRHEQKVGLSPAQVVVITRQEIIDSGATSLTDLLRRWPVLDVYEFDPLYPTIEARNTYRVMLLIDGREFNLEMFVSPFYNLLPVGLEDIERIEIVLGPSSAIYGANAVSAVINIITKKPGGGFGARARLSAGEHGSLQVEGQVQGGGGPVDFRLSGGIDRADFWMQRAVRARDVAKADAQVLVGLPGGELVLDGGMSLVTGKIFGIVGYLGTDGVVIHHAAARLKLGSLEARLWWSGIRGPVDLELGLYHPDLGVTLGSIPTVHLTGDTVHSEVQYQFEPWTGNLLIAGADTRYTRYHAPELVVPAEAGAHTVTEWRAGAYFHDEQHLGRRWLLHAGLRFDWNSRTDWALSPRAAVVFNFGGHHYLRLSGGTAFRKPSVMETSMSFSVDANPAFPEVKELFEQQGVGNPDLKNELLSTVELGYQGDFLDQRLTLSANVYLGITQRIIGFATNVVLESTGRIDLANSQIGYEDSQDDYDMVGLSLDATYQPCRQWRLFLRTELHLAWWTERGNSWMRPYPRYLLAAGGNWRSDWGLHANLAATFVDSVIDTLRNPYTILAPSLEIHLPERLVLQAYLGYRFTLAGHDIDLGLTLFNPLNLRFQEKVGVIRSDGSNYGGEVLGRRIQFLLRAEM